MLVQKKGLLNRVRIVLTALVMVTGIGTTLMAMKPATDFTYQVAETANGTNWEVLLNVTDRVAYPYECRESESICTVSYDQSVSVGNYIAKNEITAQETGTFFLAPNNP